MKLDGEWCNLAQFGATWCTLWNMLEIREAGCRLMQSGVIWGRIGVTCCNLVQLSALYCNVLQIGETWCTLVQHVADWCNLMQIDVVWYRLVQLPVI